MHYSESSFAAALETSSSVASSFASVQSTSRLAPQAATTSSNLALLQPNPSARHPNKSRSNSVDRNGSVSYLSSLPIQPPSAPPPPMPPSSMSARCTSNRTARKRTPSTPHPTPSVTPPPEVTGLAAELFISTARNATTVSSSLLNAASAVNPATTPSSSAIGSLSLTFQRPPVCRIQANKYSSGVLQQEQSSKHAEHTAFPSTGPPVPERHTDIRVIAAYVPPVRRRSASCGATGRERDTPRLASHSAIIMDNQPSTITAKESLADELDNLRQALSTLKSFWDGPLGAPPGASSARESLRWRDRGGFAAFVRAVVRNGGDDISTLQQAKVEDRTCESAKRDASDMVERGIAREGQLNGSRARDEEVEQVVRWIKAHPAMLPVLVMDIRDWDGYRLMLRRHEVLKEKAKRESYAAYCASLAAEASETTTVAAGPEPDPQEKLRKLLQGVGIRVPPASTKESDTVSRRGEPPLSGPHRPPGAPSMRRQKSAPSKPTWVQSMSNEDGPVVTRTKGNQPSPPPWITSTTALPADRARPHFPPSASGPMHAYTHHADQRSTWPSATTAAAAAAAARAHAFSVPAVPPIPSLPPAAAAAAAAASARRGHHFQSATHQWQRNPTFASQQRLDSPQPPVDPSWYNVATSGASPSSDSSIDARPPPPLSALQQQRGQLLAGLGPTHGVAAPSTAAASAAKSDASGVAALRRGRLGQQRQRTPSSSASHLAVGDIDSSGGGGGGGSSAGVSSGMKRRGWKELLAGIGGTGNSAALGASSSVPVGSLAGLGGFGAGAKVFSVARDS